MAITLKDTADYFNLRVVYESIVKRGKIMSGNFNEEGFALTHLEDRVFESLPRLTRLVGRKNPEDHEKAQQIFCLAARVDFEDPNLKLGHRNCDKLSSVSAETIFTLTEPSIFHNTTSQSMRETIDLLITGILSEEKLKDYLDITKNIQNKNNSKLYPNISHYNIKKIDDDTLKFIDRGISLHYFKLYKALHYKDKEEFWNWQEIDNILKNPANEFFEAKIKLNRLHPDWKPMKVLNKIKRIRLGKIAFAKDNFSSNEILSRDYDWFDEISDIQHQIDSFPDNFQRTVDKASESNLHHVLFPKYFYEDSYVLHEFREDYRNKIQISINSHKKIHAAIDRFEKKFGIPEMTHELLREIKQRRTISRDRKQDNYLDFLYLRLAICEIVIEKMPSKQNNRVSDLFVSAARFFDFLSIQSEFITLKTIRQK